MHTCQRSVPSDVDTKLPKWASVQGEVTSRHVRPLSEVISIFPGGTLLSIRPDGKATASTGEKFKGSLCTGDQVRPASRLDLTSYSQSVPFRHGYVTLQTTPADTEMLLTKTAGKLTGSQVPPASWLTKAPELP